MDRHGIKLATMALGIAVCLVAAGCLFRSRAPAKAPTSAATASTTARALSAIGGGPEAMALVAVNVRWYFYAGAAMAAAGAAMILFRAFGTAVILFVMGGVTGYLGVGMLHYPWLILLVAVGLAGTLAFVAWDRLRTRNVLETTTEAIQNAAGGKSVKSRIASMGKEVEERVRSVVSPIKKKLAKAGRI